MKKAKIISQRTDTGTPNKLILVGAPHNIVISVCGADVQARVDHGIENDQVNGYEVLCEVEVPDELIEKATALVRAQKELNNIKWIPEDILRQHT